MQARATLVLFAMTLMTTSAIAQNNFPTTGDVTIGTSAGVAPLTVSSGAGGAVDPRGRQRDEVELDLEGEETLAPGALPELRWV